jgi:hypothetical protein
VGLLADVQDTCCYIRVVVEYVDLTDTAGSSAWHKQIGQQTEHSPVLERLFACLRLLLAAVAGLREPVACLMKNSSDGLEERKAV